MQHLWQVLSDTVSDHEIKETLDNFFHDYSCIEKQFNADDVEKAKLQNQSSFSLLNIPDVSVEWRGFKQSTVMVVGVKSSVASAMQKLSGYITNMLSLRWEIGICCVFFLDCI